MNRSTESCFVKYVYEKRASVLNSRYFLDLVQIGLIGAVIATGIVEGEDKGIYKGHLAVYIGVSWVRLIYIFAALNYKVAVIIDEFIAVSYPIVLKCIFQFP